MIFVRSYCPNSPEMLETGARNRMLLVARSGMCVMCGVPPLTAVHEKSAGTARAMDAGGHELRAGSYARQSC